MPMSDGAVLVLPMARTTAIKKMTAWINGTPLEVRDYRHPRNRSLGTYWADLVGSAAIGGEENMLVIHQHQ